MSGYKTAVKQTKNFFIATIPIVCGVLLLIALVHQLIGFEKIKDVFVYNNFINVILGAGIGGVIAGNPIISYMLGGEFLKYGIDLVVVIAFLVAWVTVGIVQLPAESILLGKKFAIIRNLVSFVSAIIIAFLTVLFLNIL